MVTPLYELTCDYVRMSGKIVLHIINQVCDPFKKNNIMRMNNIFKQILLCIALLSCMACSGLNSKSSNNNGKMDTAFIWRAFVASPKFYPMEVMYANVRLGNTDEWVGTMERFTGAGLGEYNGVVDTSNESEDSKLPVPSAIDVLWLSHTLHYRTWLRV